VVEEHTEQAGAEQAEAEGAGASTPDPVARGRAVAPRTAVPPGSHPRASRCSVAHRECDLIFAR
jgi:hypothetical protein